MQDMVVYPMVDMLPSGYWGDVDQMGIEQSLTHKHCLKTTHAKSGRDIGHKTLHTTPEVTYNNIQHFIISKHTYTHTLKEWKRQWP